MGKKTKRTQRSKSPAAEAGAAKEAPAAPGTSPAWEPYAIAGGVVAILGLNALLGRSASPWAWRVASFLGIPFIVGLALLMSCDRRRVQLRTVLVGLGIQLALGLLVLGTGFGRAVFDYVALVFERIRDYSLAGGLMVFRNVMPDLAPGRVMFGIELVVLIVFIGALSRMLYHLGVLQRVVGGMAWLMRRLMRASGAESFAAAANVFVGMVEAPLMIRPYVAGLTRSELFTVMTAGLATVAGSVMVIYTGMLADILGTAAAGHLLTASLMSAPAAIVVAKIMIPETGEPATRDFDVAAAEEEPDEKPVNVMDAAARGALDGMKLAISVVGMLIAFVALVALANGILGAVSGGHLSFQKIAGWAFSPVAVGMGIPLGDAAKAGELMGTKTVLNEWLAYDALSKMGGGISAHTARVMSYALCGFANFGSVAIMIAGIGGIAPKRRGDLARLGLLSLVSGTLAAFMTGCWAGLLG